jgi:hypothetical protein
VAAGWSEADIRRVNVVVRTDRTLPHH